MALSYTDFLQLHTNTHIHNKLYEWKHGPTHTLTINSTTFFHLLTDFILYIAWYMYMRIIQFLFFCARLIGHFAYIYISPLKLSIKRRHNSAITKMMYISVAIMGNTLKFNGLAQLFTHIWKLVKTSRVQNLQPTWCNNKTIPLFGHVFVFYGYNGNSIISYNKVLGTRKVYMYTNYFTNFSSNLIIHM